MGRTWWGQRWVKWITFLSIILVLVGGYEWYQYWHNTQLANRTVTAKVTDEMTRDTLKQESIKPFSQSDFLRYRQAAFDHHVDQYPNGYLVIKRPEIRVPIYNRANNYTLALGVGKSYFLDSQMGQGNYVVAGHNMQMPGVLLSNLYEVHMGDQMSIIDKNYVYHYRVNLKHKVSPNVTLINGKAAKGTAFYLPTGKEAPLLTVYTCADGGADRLLVQGQFTGKQRK